MTSPHAKSQRDNRDEVDIRDEPFVGRDGNEDYDEYDEYDEEYYEDEYYSTKPDTFGKLNTNCDIPFSCLIW